jgi:hypothetical protein
VRWAIVTLATALSTGSFQVGTKPVASSAHDFHALPPPCPNGSVLLPTATVHLGHGARAPWVDHVESIHAFCIDRAEFSVSRLVACVSAGACFATR